MPHGILYVPMLGNKKTLKNINAVTSYPYVLLFNEPDVSGALTKSISPEEAASLFKNVMNKLQNIKVISPAPQNPWNNWLTNFNSMSFNSKPMNAVAMHWYGLPDINKFKRDVLYIHNKYKVIYGLLNLVFVFHVQITLLRIKGRCLIFSGTPWSSLIANSMLKNIVGFLPRIIHQRVAI